MLKIEGLKKEYKDFELNVSLEVRAGQIMGIVGQNGAGKSTLFKSVLGLVGFEGDISLFGKNVREFTPCDKENLGVSLADSGFSGYLTVSDIIPILRAMYKSFDGEYFSNGLKRFELPEKKQIKEFSTGMRAKLKVLAALSHRAKMLILDEPTAGLDIVARDELLLIIREYMEKYPETAVLISSHISSDLENLCDDIYMIHRGKKILHEDTDILLDSYGILKAESKQYETIDKKHIKAIVKEPYGYSCLTNERSFYTENYPEITVEKAGIDSIISALIKGKMI